MNYKENTETYMKMYKLWQWLGNQHDWHFRNEVDLMDADTDENGFKDKYNDSIKPSNEK